MNKNLLFDFSVDKANCIINAKREFAAEIDLVWDAWTKPEILDQWWAPKPYRTETKSMDFREGGSWLYAMISPENVAHWCKADYKKIEVQRFYSALDAFCDEQGNINKDFPRSLWANTFNGNDSMTVVSISIKYETLNDLEKIIELGFKEGFSMALGNLDEYFEKKFKLRSIGK
jgi:PhnB protein